MWFSGKYHKASGQACVELAIILPILVVLIVCIYDLSCAIRANNTISNMSREGANLAARSGFARQDILNVLALTANPLDMRDNGMIYITVVQGTAGQPQIQSQAGWQNSNLRNTISSQIGTPTPSNPNPPAQNLGNLTLAQNQQANIVEVFYNYQSLFSKDAKRLYARTVF